MQSVESRELGENIEQVLASLEAEGEDLVITTDGKPTAVVVDMEKYLEMQEALREFSDPAFVAGLLEARAEIRAGTGVRADDVFRKKGL